MQTPGAVSFYWQPLFTILRTSEYASYFSPILAGFEHRNRKNCLKNHGLPDRAKTSIFVTSAPRASFWPSLTKFHIWLFPSLGDSKAKLVLIGIYRVIQPSLRQFLLLLCRIAFLSFPCISNANCNISVYVPTT